VESASRLVSVGAARLAKASSEGWRLRLRPNIRGGEELAVAGVVAGVRGGEELVVAGAGEFGAGVGGDLGAGVDLLGEELPTPPAPSKWTYSMVKSYVGVVSSSTTLAPCPTPILALRRTLRRAPCAQAVFLGQGCGRPSSPPRSQ
jgi:hypothetical protein